MNNFVKKEVMPGLSIGAFKSKMPIIQGGMGVGISLSSLASAVANAGGVGVIAGAGLGFDNPGYRKNPLETSRQVLREEIQKARKLTDGIIGVNIMAALTNFSDMVRTGISEGIDVIFAGAGLPLDLPGYLSKGCKTALVPIISSARAADIIIKKWVMKYDFLPDAFVVEGPLAGGHLGFKEEDLNNCNFSLERLIPQVLEKIKSYEEKFKKKIPVIAAGGIFSGGDIHKFLKLGAAGVQMGTRFVATNECDASDEFKKQFLKCTKEDIGIIKSPVGLPGRAIRNKFISDSQEGKKHPFKCPFHCIKTCKLEESPYCIALALLNAKKGNMQGGFAFAGTNAHEVKEILSVEKLMDNLKKEYKEAVEKQDSTL